MTIAHDDRTPRSHIADRTIAMSRHRSVFVNPSGQRDNLGDSLLRRAYLRRLRSMGQLHVLIGSHDDYASGLGLEPHDVLYRSRRQWLTALAAAPRRSVFAFNAGEIVLDRRFLLTLVWAVPAMLRIMLGSGVAVAEGISVRDHRSRVLPLLRAFLRMFDRVIWRDPVSARSVGLGVVRPDWAFALGDETPRNHSRPHVALTFRHDRPAPTPQQVAALDRALRQTGFTPVVVVQVRRDQPRASALAAELGCELVDWPASRDHAGQERVLRDVYSRSSFVVSDRIHALIVGITEGAAPIGTGGGALEKVVRTMSPVSDRDVIAHAPYALDTVLQRLQNGPSELRYWQLQRAACRASLLQQRQDMST